MPSCQLSSLNRSRPMHAMVQVQHSPRPCLRRLPPLLVAVMVVSALAAAAASPERDLYALSKLKSSLLSRSSRDSSLLADWDTSSPAASSPVRQCNFSGITCDASNRVVAINLTDVPLHGGELPAEISLLDALSNLTVASCSLSGPVPASLSSMPLLRHVNLSNNNLAGPFSSQPERRHPTDAAPAPYFPSLETIDVYNNNFLGPLPPFGRSHSRLRYLHLGGNYFTGAIPDAYGDMKGLEYLGLNANSLSGRIPPSLSRLKRLRQMYLGYYNSFDGGIPAEFGELEALVHLHMAECNLTGPIPPELGRLTRLEKLFLQTNNLFGEIPTELGNLENLVSLVLFGNELTGEIPPHLCAGRRLQYLSLMENELSGSIPEDLGNCKTLTYVILKDNFLNGSIPAGLFGLPTNYMLDLSNNLLSGELPDVIAGVGLSFLSVASNNLSGLVPPEIGYLKNLSSLNVSANALTGAVPRELSHCDMLTVLDLSGNRLTGEIPNEITNLKVLTSLNLSRNGISGELPPEILGMNSLTMLDVSYNNLSGRVSLPQQEVFAVLDERCFEGNPGLCVEHVTVASCSGLQQSSDTKSMQLWALWLVVPTVGTLAVAMYLGLRRGRRAWQEAAERRSRAWKMTRFQNLELDVDDVLGCLREENIIGRGGAGTVYRCAARGGAEVAIKRLPGPGPRHRRDHGFRAEVTTLGGIRHRNIVQLLGFASSSEGNLLVYEYMPMGSLGRVLHGESGGRLGWAARYRVATEAARALCYLHHECSPRILHRDVKSNNILLDSAMEAHIADFGLAKFLNRGASGSGTRVAAEECSVVAGTYGYIAPEYAYTLRVDEKTDVYSFGVVLLELVTGRRPLGDFGEEIDLVHWARSAVPRPADTAAVLALADPRLAPEPVGPIARLFRVGMSCVRESSSARPTMREVVHVLSSSATPAADPACSTSAP